MTKEQIIKVAEEYPQKGAKILAKELNTSEANINYIVHRLRKKGIKIDRPEARITDFGEAVKELKNKKI